MVWVARRFCQPVIGSDRRRDLLRFACATRNHANKRARVSAQNSRYELATLNWTTMPMHTADDSYFTILSASLAIAINILYQGIQFGPYESFPRFRERQNFSRANKKFKKLRLAERLHIDGLMKHPLLLFSAGRLVYRVQPETTFNTDTLL